MRDGLHDGGVVRIALVLAALLVPVRQLLVDVVVKLSRQTRERITALGVIAVTGGAGWNVGFRNAFKVDLLALGEIFLRRAAERFRVETVELVREGRLHLRRKYMGDV